MIREAWKRTSSSVFFLVFAFAAAGLAATAFAFTLAVTAPCFNPLGLATVPALGAAAICLVCVARFPPLAVFSLPPRAVAPVPLLANRPRLSLEYFRATKKLSQGS